MRKIILISIVAFAIPCIIYARKTLDDNPVGRILKPSSSNKIYSMEIKYLGYPDNSPSKCIFKKKGEVLWVKELPTTPGHVDISNNGNYIVFANWGMYDEGHFNSLSFYNGDGDLLNTINFDGEIYGGMKHIRKTSISNNGNHYITVTVYDDHIEICSYCVPTQTINWKKTIGLDFFNNMITSKSGEYILICTGDFFPDKTIARFTYLNETGNILWEKDIENGFSWSNKDYIELSEDGLTIRIFDLSRNTWEEYKNNNGEIESEE